MIDSPVPANELQRLSSLGSLDLDYSGLKEDFENIVTVASKVAEMDVSLINLIDPYTQWTIANHGFDLESMPREDSVCQYTIMGDNSFEVSDLSADERFQNLPFVSGKPDLKYYFGIPLTTQNGVNIGALCVLDSKLKKISAEKIEILKILAQEVITKLKTYNAFAKLTNELTTSSTRQKKIAQDVRDPLAGIIGITEILIEQQCEPKEETLGYISLINESSKLILDITDHVLIEEPEQDTGAGDIFNMKILQERLQKMYVPLAEKKNIHLDFKIEPYKIYFPIPKGCVLQIAGVLISSAINLLPFGERLCVEIDVYVEPQLNTLTLNILGNTGANAGTYSNIHSQAITLAQELTQKLSGELTISGQAEKIKYVFTFTYSA